MTEKKEKRVTKKEMFNEISAFISACETIEAEKRTAYLNFLKHESELLENKKSSGKLSKTQEENETIKGIMLETLKYLDGAGLADIEIESRTVFLGSTITEIQNAEEKLAKYQNQKLSALMRQLVKEGKVTKVVSQKRSMFALIGTVKTEWIPNKAEVEGFPVEPTVIEVADAVEE